MPNKKKARKTYFSFPKTFQIFTGKKKVLQFFQTFQIFTRKRHFSFPQLSKFLQARKRYFSFSWLSKFLKTVSGGGGGGGNCGLTWDFWRCEKRGRSSGCALWGTGDADLACPGKPSERKDVHWIDTLSYIIMLLFLLLMCKVCSSTVMCHEFTFVYPIWHYTFIPFSENNTM